MLAYHANMVTHDYWVPTGRQPVAAALSPHALFLVFIYFLVYFHLLFLKTFLHCCFLVVVLLIAYPCDELLEYWRGAGVPSGHIPEELWKPYHRGRKVMGNVRSLTNKTDELAALVSSQRALRECSLLCFTETWLIVNTPDSLLELVGYMLVRADWGKQSSKNRGGGLAVFVNSKWCNSGHVTVKACICTRTETLLSATGVLARHCCYCLYSTISCCGECKWRHPLSHCGTSDATSQCPHIDQWGY